MLHLHHSLSPLAECSFPTLHTATSSSLQPCCRKPAHHTLASSPDTEEWGREAGLLSSGHSVQPVPALRCTGRSFSNHIHLCDQAQEFPALL